MKGENFSVKQFSILVLAVVLSWTWSPQIFAKAEKNQAPSTACKDFVERAGYWLFLARVNLWEADEKFFDLSRWPQRDPESARLKQINRFIFYVRKQSPHRLPLRKEIIAQAKILKKSLKKNLPDETQVFDPEIAERLIGKKPEEISFHDLLKYFRDHQTEIQEQGTRGAYFRRPPSVKIAIGVASTAAGLAFFSFAYRYTNTLAGSGLSAPSELHGSDARRASFVLIFGSPQFEAALDQAAFRNYNTIARQYPRELNTMKGLWEQYGFNESQAVADFVASATRSLQLNAWTDNFDSVRLTESRRLYQLFFAFPEYFQSDFGRELNQSQRIREVLEAYDPEAEALRDLFRIWEDARNFQWTESDIAEAKRLMQEG